VLIDSSGSINFADKANFDRVRNFTKAIVGSFELGENKTRVAIINYSNRAQVEISLLNGTSIKSVVKAIDEMRYLNSKLYYLHLLRVIAFLKPIFNLNIFKASPDLLLARRPVLCHRFRQGKRDRQRAGQDNLWPACRACRAGRSGADSGQKLVQVLQVPDQSWTDGDHARAE